MEKLDVHTAKASFSLCILTIIWHFLQISTNYTTQKLCVSFVLYNFAMEIRAESNIDDLASYFKITDVNQAIYDTIEDSDRLQCLILDISPWADLDKLFRPLENSRSGEMLLSKEKARLKEYRRHTSWLRIYAIKLEPGTYVITGGAIKLTRTMQEREHTLHELEKMEKVRRFMLENDIIDKDAFTDYMSELS